MVQVIHFILSDPTPSKSFLILYPRLYLDLLNSCLSIKILDQEFVFIC